MPVVAPRVDVASRVPVVLVPGITGSVLRDQETGEVLWGRGPEVLAPKDGGYLLARPIVPVGADAPDRLEAVEAIEQLRLFGGLVRKPVYGPVLETLVANGWVLGDLDAPDEGADLYAFAYDWRQDNVQTVGELLVRLRALARAHQRGAGDAPFAIDLICQSNGAHICRYLTKYGDAEPEDALAGRAESPSELRIRKMVLVGTSNGGSVRILREVHRGRRYVPLIGRTMQPETLFTFPAILQDLPAFLPEPFVDGRGRRLDIDLFDAETWQAYGLSVFSDEARDRMASRPDLFGTEADRVDYLRRNLQRARRFHDALSRDVARFDTAYYLLQSGYGSSPERAVLRSVADGYELLFTGDEELEQDPYLHHLVSSPGDGHATYDSQRALSPQELRALAAPAYLVDGSHFEMILDPATLRRMVDFLHMPLPSGR
ncbi:MAG: hypothetical protein MPN21_00090 [Thermoanaerobaculia bacterium]|nr:hypothetical protein [Thermoanaerobaculia bacterium]